MNEPKPELTHADFAAGNAILHATVQIIRANTGKVETYQITGTPLKEQENGSNPQHSVS